MALAQNPKTVMSAWFYNLSRVQCDFLIDHVDGSRPVTHVASEDATRSVLLRGEFIRFVTPPTVDGRPAHTVLTDKGREMLCIILEKYISALTRAGYRVDRGQCDPNYMVEVGTELPRKSKDEWE